MNAREFPPSDIRRRYGIFGAGGRASLAVAYSLSYHGAIANELPPEICSSIRRVCYTDARSPSAAFPNGDADGSKCRITVRISTVPSVAIIEGYEATSSVQKRTSVWSDERSPRS